MQYFNEFTDKMGQLFAKIQTKENEAKRKIEEKQEAVNLKAFTATFKKV